MTTWLGDGTVAHLRDVAEWPDAGDRYEVTGRLGRGGMGVVYAARDRVLDRDVAIKVLDAFDTDGDGARRLLAEAKILGRLEHPGIVPVHDAGTLPDGRVFYVMKRVRGVRLDAALAARSLAERLELFLRICDAVAFAHAHGIVHRDLKPENVMLGPFGEVLVMDWGAAKSAAADDGVVVGTPGYMAPEQRGRASDVDARADVYALGAVLETMLQPVVPRPLAAVANRARAHDPAARYDTVHALAREVLRFREGAPVQAYRESPLERMRRVYKRHRLPITLVLVYMIVRVVLLFAFGT